MTEAPTDAPISPVAFVLKGYPRLSETFIAQEMLALERRGLEIEIISLRWPTDKSTHPMHEAIAAKVRYLPEYLYQEPARVWRGWRRARALPGYRAARAAFLADLKRDRSPNRVRRFGQALVLAAELPERFHWLHAHFLHTPASVTRYAAIMRGLPWSFSAHARDIWTSPDWELSEKIAEAEWGVTCTALNARHLGGLTEGPAKVDLVYHGLDLSRFPEPPEREGREGPVVIVSVGRAVEKKGYDDLIDALAKLPEGRDWRFIHIGGGPLKDALKARAAAAGLEARIEWRGALAQTEVIEALREADIFALASRVAADGDRDGLPNVLMEAATQGLPAVATDVSAIPEFIVEGETGLMAPERDADALATALARLIAEPETRLAMGRAAAARVRAAFSFEAGIDDLARRFRIEGRGEGA